MFKRLRPKATAEGSLVVLLLAMAGRMVFSLGLTILLGRNLSAEDFGFFALVSTVFTLAHELTDMGSANVAIRDAVRAPRSERQLLESLLGWRWILSIVAALGCAVLALFQDTAVHELILLATGGALLFAYLSAFSMVFQLRQTQLPPAVLSVMAQAVALGACAVLVGVKAAGAVFSLVVPVRELASMYGNRLLAVRILNYTPRPRLRHTEMRGFVGKATVVAATTLFYHLQFQGGIVFVQFLRPAEEVGAFAAATRPVTPFLALPWLLMLPLVPLLSWLAANRRAEFRAQSLGTLNLCVGVGAVIAVASAEMAPAVLQFFYGSRFVAGTLSAIGVFRWMALPVGCAFVTAAMATVLLADNRERQLLYLSAVSLAFYAAANFVLLPRFQFTGSAIATALAEILMTLGGLWLLRQGSDSLMPGWRTLCFLAPGAALGAVLPVLSGPPILQLALAGVFSAAALLAVWRLPGVARYRAEQARLSVLARPDGPHPQGQAGDG